MLFRVSILAIASIVLSSCVSGPQDYFKRSANNKLFDMYGANGGKRAPLYNKKYIEKAKKNIISGDYDDEDEEDTDEVENSARDNIEMYQAMIEEDMNRKYQKNKKRRKTKVYPNLVDASSNVEARSHSDNLELKEELRRIKEMLKETQNDMGNYKCPTAQELERQQNKSSVKQVAPSSDSMQDKSTEDEINKIIKSI